MELLSIEEAVQAQREAFEALVEGNVCCPVRPVIQTEHGPSLFMPALIRSSHALAIKVVSVREQNASNNLPGVIGKMIVLDEETGQMVAVMDGTYMTALRTAAGSGYATSCLAPSSPSNLVVFGAGMQAKMHILVMLHVRPSITTVLIANRTVSKAKALAESLSETHPKVTFAAIEESDYQKHVSEADIICTTTNASSPVFEGSWLTPGTHINSIGSYKPTMQEVDAETISKAKVVVDDMESCMEEAGDLLIPLSEGVIEKSHILCAAGERDKIMNVRTNDSDITYFKSVGNAAQDAVTARMIYEKAVAQGVGIQVDD